MKETNVAYFSICRLEVVLLLVVYLAYGYTKKGAVSYILISLSSWFMAISWLFAPYMFNPSGFEWQKWVHSTSKFTHIVHPYWHIWHAHTHTNTVCDTLCTCTCWRTYWRAWHLQPHKQLLLFVFWQKTQ